MKKLSLLLVLLSISIVSFAQTQVATLQHGDDISVFYGATAFIEAHDEAENGDIVTLSSGAFSVPNPVTKAITLRGAGCDIDSTAGTLPTIIPSGIEFSIEDDGSTFLTVEGILFQGHVYVRFHHLIDPKFIRCQFDGPFCQNSYAYMYHAQFINCFFPNVSYFSETRESTMINCVAWDLWTSNNTNLTVYNSFINIGNDWLSTVYAYNSIIGNSYNSTHIVDQNCTFYYCVGIKNGHEPSFFQYQSNTSNIEVDTEEDVFAEEGFYVLNDEIASGFLGSDGTQVGIYGGFMPYSNRPTYMVLKRCNVANKSTIDGKLSVEIEVVTEE